MSALYAELERETLRVAQLRREAPGRAKRAFEEALRREVEGDERILRELERKRGTSGGGGEEGEREGGGGGGGPGDLGVRELERGEEIAKGYEEGVGILMGLQSVGILLVFYWRGREGNANTFFDLLDRNCRLSRTDLLELRMHWIMSGPRGLREVEGARGRGGGSGPDVFFGFVLYY